MEATIDKDLIIKELYEALAELKDTLDYDPEYTGECEKLAELLATHESAYNNAAEALYQ